MTMIVAVSGGVDSVVLLHMLVSRGQDKLVVAHFDHGIRDDSDADARFVEALAKGYGLSFEGRREELGSGASEAIARTRRYAFLREVAMRHEEAVVATAHHSDDVIETIAINIHRGTGWRGVSILDTKGIIRPLSGLMKREIYDYAVANNLEWVEDETNATDAYLRNRLRSQLQKKLSNDERKKLIDLWHAQKLLKRQIDEEVIRLLPPGRAQSRYFFTHIDDGVALELLRHITQGTATRPQYKRALHAIKTARPGADLEVGAGVKLKFSRTDFIAEIPQ